MNKQAIWAFRIVMCVFLLLALVFGGIGGGLYIHSAAFKANAMETDAVITDIIPNHDSGYDVYVSYTVDGEEYNGRLDMYQSRMREGDMIRIFYDPADPWRIQSDALPLVGIIFLAIGGFFLLIAIIFLTVSGTGKRRKRRLLESVAPIQAEVAEVRLNMFYHVNGRNPYQIVCKVPDTRTGTDRYLHSENIWQDPSFMLSEKRIRTLPVYIDPANPKRYYISLEPLSGKDFASIRTDSNTAGYDSPEIR